MACGFEVQDCFGRTVLLDHSNWEAHLPKHPELVPYHDLLPQVLLAPDMVIEAPRTGEYHFYRRGLPVGRYGPLWLHLVVAYYEPDPGKLKTAFFTKRPIRGVQRWPI